MTHNKLLEMCKNAICVTNARGCFKLFVKSTLYSTIILCGRGHQKGIKLDKRDFFSAAARKRHRQPSRNFVSAHFRQTDKIRRRRPNSAAQGSASHPKFDCTPHGHRPHTMWSYSLCGRGVLRSGFYSAPQCSHCKRCTSYGNSVCLSVCPSATRRYCVKTMAHIVRCSLHCQIAKCV